jgi:dGTPase
MMDWSQLLTRKRLGKKASEDPQSESGRTCFQKDYDRLIFSASFRSLKDKTQIFPLSKNDYVRTRSIHSLEVSCVGRSLGEIVGREIINRHQLLDFTPSDFGDIVCAACLAHDIGNPPFGHAGEDAIRNAFKDWYSGLYQSDRAMFTMQQKADFDMFEGNAQGFRIVARQEVHHVPGGMQLTCPTLATFMKYPRESYIPEYIFEQYRTQAEQNSKSTLKYGFFQAETELFTEVAKTVGLIKRHPDYAWWARHPLVFLVEAADDICYHIVDLEDGHYMNYIKYREARKLLEEIVKPVKPKSPVESEVERIRYLRAKAIGTLVEEIAEIFLAYEQEILAGTFDRDLIYQSKHCDVLKEILQITHDHVYFHPDVIRIQIAGYRVLGDLFFQFVDAALNGKNNHRSSIVQKMMPEKYRPLDRDNCYEKILKVTDYISGMTDSFATSLFQQFRGISLS